MIDLCEAKPCTNCVIIILSDNYTTFVIEANKTCLSFSHNTPPYRTYVHEALKTQKTSHKFDSEIYFIFAILNETPYSERYLLKVDYIQLPL